MSAAVPHACPVCGRRFVVVAGEAVPDAARCSCGGVLAADPLPSGVYEIRRARRSERPSAEAEPDLGYGGSHGYGPAHGGPTGPADAPGRGEPEKPR